MKERSEMSSKNADCEMWKDKAQYIVQLAGIYIGVSWQAFFHAACRLGFLLPMILTTTNSRRTFLSNMCWRILTISINGVSERHVERHAHIARSPKYGLTRRQSADFGFRTWNSAPSSESCTPPFARGDGVLRASRSRRGLGERSRLIKPGVR